MVKPLYRRIKSTELGRGGFVVSETDLKQMQRMFTEVRPVRGFEDIASQIQQAILDGSLKVGDRLPNERDLGAVFGVSRPTLREAIRGLEAAGIVEVHRGTTGGIFVSKPKAEQVGRALSTLIRFQGATSDELAEFRVTFEMQTAMWAARRASDLHIMRLQGIAEEFGKLSTEPTTKWSTLVDLDLEFHVEVANASQNRIRVAIMSAVHDVIRRDALSIGDYEDMAWRAQQKDDLLAIARAIAEHDEMKSAKRMQAHVSRNVRAVVGDETELL